MDRKNLYIPSLDAKDVYLANNYIVSNNHGYELSKKNGEENIKKFINSFDYCLDLIELRQIAQKVYKNKDTLSFMRKGKEFSSKIINITFKYSVKEFNDVAKGLYIKNGYRNSPSWDWSKGYILDENNDLIGIQTDTPFDVCIEKQYLPNTFDIEYDPLQLTYKYVKNKKAFKTIMSSKDLRTWIYTNGFLCNGIKYRRFKRSSGSARVGKCLFIDERLYPDIHKSEQCGLDIKDGDDLNIAAFEAYIALPTSSIIDTLDIAPENILVIDDYESKFTDSAICTDEDENHHLITSEKEMQICNSIWDGQSLIDPSIMGQYSDKGMLLLRNKFFKSACFNTNIQQFFKDNNITEISQLKGTTFATDISQIKMITTPSSIKFYKFGDYETWCKNIYPYFGIVKYDKNTHYFDGRLVQAHYQLINTLQLSDEEVKALVKDGVDYISAINTNPDVMRYHLKFSAEAGNLDNVMYTKNDCVYKMLNYKCDFDKTKVYYDFKKDLCRSYIKNMMRGHILVNGTYATLLGNPYEMLTSSIGKFDGSSTLQPGEVHNIRFPYNTELLASRSPHVTIGNILLTKNVACEKIDQYFNLTNNIICINSINENILERLSGADFDSDVALITDNKIMINSAKRNYNIFKVPTRNINPKNTKYKYTLEDLAKLDYVTSVNKIGEIVNLSQELNSLLWELIYNSGETVEEQYDYIKEIYYDVCQLDVMSNIEIDKAKKTFECDNAQELDLIRAKYQNILQMEDGRKRIPDFLGFIAKLKNYDNPARKDYSKYHTSMDYLVNSLTGVKSGKSKGSDFLTLADLFYFDEFDKGKSKYNQIEKIIEYAQETFSKLKGISASKMNYEEKKIRSEIIKNDFLNEINKLKISKHTMYRLLKKIDEDKNSSVSNLIFYTLFNYKNDVLTEMLNMHEKVNEFIFDDENGDIEFYNMHFSKKKSTF